MEKMSVDKLRRARIDAGLSSRALALKAGLSHGAVWRAEKHGSASPATLKKIADALGMRASELLES
jgi:transcriptional regulator with XRE-family HTH domain